MAESREALQRFIAVWDEELRERGMRINEEKTEVMLISKEEEEVNIRVRDQELKQVDQFKYLGVCFGTGNVINIELNSRIEKFNNTLRLLYPLIRDRNVPRKVKIVIYVSILRPILTYGCEAWALTTKTKSKIQACEMRVLRSIKGVTRRDRMRNDDIREELGV